MIGSEEIVEAIDSLVSGELTMGKKCAQFEEDFAKYIGSKHAIFVNSGSTANLLMMSVLTNPKHQGLDGEIIVPALTWSTTLWPVIQTGCTPVLVDCDETLNIDPQKVEAAITDKTQAIFVAHILGNGCDMSAICDIADRYNLILIEDTCESLGVEYSGKKLGTFGLMGSYSFYYSHHITTIEGGMIVTDDDETADLLRCMRAHGWTRHLIDRSIEDAYPEIDPKFLFVNSGYSVRPTEIQGAFGIHQLRKIESFAGKRRETHKVLTELFSNYPVELIPATDGIDPVWFGFPFLTKDRRAVSYALDQVGISNRPIIAGNLAHHPGTKLFHVKHGELPVADKIMREGIYIDCFDPDVDKIRAVMDLLYGNLGVAV